ncbi:GNAT family N-acetyltransferase [Paenibacillus hodogayensis]|uniref:GNAT family N-acetyltransferase n=1 Tax=Paenibacillus hodogayensis TaxID=279208 RepID=A0ABV5VQT9_9BACL
MISPRRINIEDDKHLVLEFHCQTNYASDTPWARKTSYDHYREKWFSTSQPNEFYSYFVETLQDQRSIAEIWIDEETNKVVGYLWVTFNDIVDYGLSVAEINDLLITPEFQGRGLGLQMLKYIEKKAIEKGANLLRSQTGIENTSSQKLHEKFGFHTYRVLFEKKLDSIKG